MEIAWGLKGAKQMGLDRQEQPSTREIPKAKAPAFEMPSFKPPEFKPPEMPNPFGGGAPKGRVVPSQQESAAPAAEAAPKKLSLAERLMAEEAAKKGTKKKGFFG